VSPGWFEGSFGKPDDEENHTDNDSYKQEQDEKFRSAQIQWHGPRAHE